ncbi:MAG: leucine-rich repeat domain-containing protein [Clostridia bacterium]|nr:leucine-rich repeat domain-containing protein [Clostridia bacterium]
MTDQPGYGEDGTYRWRIEPDGTAVITACKSLEMRIHIPEVLGGQRVSGIGEGAFARMESLFYVKAPDGMVSVGPSAFADCIHLNWVTLGDGLLFIGEEAFAGCISLFHIRIPGSVCFIGDRAFEDCSRLRRLDLPEGLSALGKE